MKLLDPFSGYRLAQGHPYFHVALFICSWTVNIVDKNDQRDPEEHDLTSAFEMLRWAHFLLILLSAGQSILSRSSKIDDEGVQARINNNDSED